MTDSLRSETVRHNILQFPAPPSSESHCRSTRSEHLPTELVNKLVARNEKLAIALGRMSDVCESNQDLATAQRELILHYLAVAQEHSARIKWMLDAEDSSF